MSRSSQLSHTDYQNVIKYPSISLNFLHFFLKTIFPRSNTLATQIVKRDPWPLTWLNFSNLIGQGQQIAAICIMINIMIPASTQRNKRVIITSKHRFDVTIACLLRFVFARIELVILSPHTTMGVIMYNYHILLETTLVKMSPDVSNIVWY